MSIITSKSGFFANDTISPTTATDLESAVASALASTEAATAASEAAAASADAAASSATAAAGSASSAAISATAVTAAITAAQSAADTASEQATAAANSATSASSSASEAANAATSSAGYAASSAAAATDALAAATNTGSFASSASSSATAAATSATAAASSATAAAASATTASAAAASVTNPLSTTTTSNQSVASKVTFNGAAGVAVTNNFTAGGLATHNASTVLNGTTTLANNTAFRLTDTSGGFAKLFVDNTNLLQLQGSNSRGVAANIISLPLRNDAPTMVVYPETQFNSPINLFGPANIQQHSAHVYKGTTGDSAPFCYIGATLTGNAAADGWDDGTVGAQVNKINCIDQVVGTTGSNRWWLQVGYQADAGSVGCGGALDIYAKDIGTTGDFAAGTLPGSNNKTFSLLAARSNVTITHHQGGEPGAPAGLAYALGLTAYVGGDCHDFDSVTGMEIDMGLDASSGASVRRMTAIALSKHHGWDNADADRSVAIHIGAGGDVLEAGPTSPWGAGIAFGDDGQWMFADYSIMFDASWACSEYDLAEGMPVRGGVDLLMVDPTESIFRSKGWSVDATGMQMGAVRFEPTSAGLKIDGVGAICTAVSINSASNDWQNAAPFKFGNGGVGIVGGLIGTTGTPSLVRILRYPYSSTSSSLPSTLSATAKPGGVGCSSLVLNVTWDTSRHKIDLNPTGGKIGLPSASLANAANDSAAATAGVAVGEMYRNGSVLMVRVA